MDILLYFGGACSSPFLFNSLLDVEHNTKFGTIYSDLLFCYNTCLCYHCPNIGFRFFSFGGNVIAALAWCIIGVCFLIGYALAIFIYKHRK